MDSDERQSLMRMAVFGQVRRLLEIHDQLTATDLGAGLTFEGERVPLVNPQRGIFKSQQMQHLLSIKTVLPKPGARIWYDDQRHVHRLIYEGEETIDYAFMGTDSNVAENRWLREAMEQQVPIIYFLGVSPGRYQAVVPAFIVGWDARAAKAQVVFGDASTLAATPPADRVERRYGLRTAQQRLHQASFRDAVITAYRGRYALSGLPEPLLPDAAHIVVDKVLRCSSAAPSNRCDRSLTQ